MFRILLCAVFVFMLVACFQLAGGSDAVLGKAKQVARDAAVESLGFIVDTLDRDQYPPGFDEEATTFFKPAALVLLGLATISFLAMILRR